MENKGRSEVEEVKDKMVKFLEKGMLITIRETKWCQRGCWYLTS